MRVNASGRFCTSLAWVACVLLVSGQACILAQPPHGEGTLAPEQAAWLHEHAVELATVSPGSGFQDLTPLRTMVGDARIVGLGEGTHGTREFFRAKHRILEYLVEEMGFSIFSIEANMPEACAINDYVMGKEGDAAELLAGLYFWTWNTEEVREMVEWMRAFNAREKSRGSMRRVQFTGNDMQTHTVALRKLEAFLQRYDPLFAAAHAEDLAALRRHSPHADVGYGCVTGQIPVELVRGKELRLAGWVRTEGLTGGRAGLWLRVDGDTPFLDTMQDRGPTGTTGWTRAEIVTHVPQNAKSVYFGMLMPGAGDGWFDGLSVDIDGVPWSDPNVDLGFESAAPKGLVHADPSGGPPPPGYTYSLDEGNPKEGARSAHLRWMAAAPGEAEMAARSRALVLLEHMSASRGAYLVAAGESATDWAIQNARVVHQWTGLGADPVRSSMHREVCMAENIAWIAEHNPGQKIVLWAHNGHVRREKPFMGWHLESKFRAGNYVNVAFCSGTGEYRASRTDGGGIGVFALEHPPAKSFEGMLGADGRGILLLDLRTARAEDPGSAWLTESRPFGGVIGSIAMAEHYRPTHLQGPFDLLVFVEATTPSRPLSNGPGERR